MADTTEKSNPRPSSSAEVLSLLPNYAQVVEYGSSDLSSVSARTTPDMVENHDDDDDDDEFQVGSGVGDGNSLSIRNDRGSLSENTSDPILMPNAPIGRRPVHVTNAITESPRKFDAVTVIVRAVKTGYEDDLKKFIENPDLFWKPIANIDSKYLEWSLEAANRGHLSIIRVLWDLFESRHDTERSGCRDGQLKQIVYGAAMHGKLDVLNWVWKNSKIDRHTHSRPDAFRVGPKAAVEGGSLAALQWFYGRGITLDMEHINIAIEYGFADIVRWYFTTDKGGKSMWEKRCKGWYRNKLDNHEIDRSVQKALILSSVLVTRTGYRSSGAGGGYYHHPTAQSRQRLSRFAGSSSSSSSSSRTNEGEYNRTHYYY